MNYDLGQYRSIRVEPLTGFIGAEISGVDLAGIDDAAFAEVRHAFHEHSVVFFRDQQLDAWDWELAEVGEPLTRRRMAYLDALEPVLQAVAADLVPALGQARLQFQPGWARDSLSLADALVVSRERDLVNGFTSIGPQRSQRSKQPRRQRATTRPMMCRSTQ